MAASSLTVCASAVRSPETGLRPEPQGVGTPAAGAALKMGVAAGNQGLHGKTVFDRHSTQSSIAARLRRAWRRFRALRVDRAVYQGAESVYKSPAVIAQVAEYRLCAAYTASLWAGTPRA